jgi:hypothetical protein
VNGKESSADLTEGIDVVPATEMELLIEELTEDEDSSSDISSIDELTDGIGSGSCKLVVEDWVDLHLVMKSQNVETQLSLVSS